MKYHKHNDTLAGHFQPLDRKRIRLQAKNNKLRDEWIEVMRAQIIELQDEYHTLTVVIELGENNSKVVVAARELDFARRYLEDSRVS